MHTLNGFDSRKKEDTDKVKAIIAEKLGLDKKESLPEGIGKL